MKNVVFAMVMALGSSALAWTVDYGPGSVVKQKQVCNGEHGTTNCKTVNYRFTAPKTVTTCYGNRGNTQCKTTKAQYNFGVIKFASKEEARKHYRDHGN